MNKCRLLFIFAICFVLFRFEMGWPETGEVNSFGVKLISGDFLERYKNGDYISIGETLFDGLNQQFMVIAMEKVMRDELDTDFSKWFVCFCQNQVIDTLSLKSAYLQSPIVLDVIIYYEGEIAISLPPDDWVFDWENTPNPGGENCGLPPDYAEVSVDQYHLDNDGDASRPDPEGPPTCDIEGRDNNFLAGWEYFRDNVPGGEMTISDVTLGLYDTGFMLYLEDDQYFNTTFWQFHPDLVNNTWLNPAENNTAYPTNPPNYYSDRFFALYYSDPPPGGIQSEYGDLHYDANGDGYPGVEGIDDDGDGYVDFEDPGVWEIYNNGSDDDGDGYVDEKPGSPGVPEEDADDWDGAIYDDDENGYPDDVVGFCFFNYPIVPGGNPVFDGVVQKNRISQADHGPKVASASAAVGSNTIGICGAGPDVKVKFVCGNGLLSFGYLERAGADAVSWSKGPGGVSRLIDEITGRMYDNQNSFIVTPFTELYDVQGLRTFHLATMNCTFLSDGNTRDHFNINLTAFMGGAYHVFEAGEWGSIPDIVKYKDAMITTSNTSPVVAVAGLTLKSFSIKNDLNWTVGEIRNRLIKGVRTWDSWNDPNTNRWRDDGKHGDGILDLYGALTYDVIGAGDQIKLESRQIDSENSPGNNDGLLSAGETVDIGDIIYCDNGYLTDVIGEYSLVGQGGGEGTDLYVYLETDLSDFGNLNPYTFVKGNPIATLTASELTPPGHLL